MNPVVMQPLLPLFFSTCACVYLGDVAIAAMVRVKDNLSFKTLVSIYFILIGAIQTPFPYCLVIYHCHLRER